MNVHQRVGERSFEYPRQIVSSRKTYKHYDKRDDRHAGEESIVVAESALPPYRMLLFSGQDIFDRWLAHFRETGRHRGE